MSDELTKSEITITYYPREGGLARYIREQDDPRLGNAGDTSLEDILRTEALAAWESAGLIDMAGDDALERKYRHLAELFWETAALVHGSDKIEDGGSHLGQFEACQQHRCRYARTIR